MPAPAGLRYSRFIRSGWPQTDVLHVDGTGKQHNVDFTNCREEKSCSGSTYAAVTSRSHHTGMVHSLLMDGSVRGITENVDLKTWQNLGSRIDGQVLGGF